MPLRRHWTLQEAKQSMVEFQYKRNPTLLVSGLGFRAFRDLENLETRLVDRGFSKSVSFVRGLGG